ncbi:ABC transporter permease protein [Methanocella paludicola SANAE]|uniref:ABC transporter permease protein n=1 Tax=Methanocella paludicola (strain DSM 17711 / JCM 13418 / NBRC 101707 / SANAE) TaxID=304371 RepID=D1YW15_METPS|nr:ABC transporter permease [Methanocella paludicola]BAI60637.1 ABC transporter permease protein [Methanocella paludicola SANAE]
MSRISRMATDIKYSLVQFLRSRQSVFFSLVFPAVFLVILGYLLGSDTAEGGVNYMGYLLSGILGMCIMFSALNETMGTISRYRANGVFNMLSVTPMSTIEWNLARIISGTFIVLLSVAVALIAAWLAFGILPAINVFSVLLVIAGAFMFIGMGMIIAYVFDDVRSPNMVSLMITLPLMMVSGSLFPIEQLPFLVQFFSILSPLTPLNDGLRSAMFSGDYGSAAVSLLISIGLGFVLFTIGVAILMGKDGQDV